MQGSWLVRISIAILSLVPSISAEAYPGAGVPPGTECEIAIDKMIKSSGMGEARSRLGSRVSATTFKRTDLSTSSPPKLVTNSTHLAEVGRLRLESNAASDEFNGITDQLRSIAQDMDSLQQIESADILLASATALRAKRISTIAKWRSAEKKSRAASDKLSAYLGRHRLALDFIDGKVAVVQRPPIDPKSQKVDLADQRFDNAKGLVKIFSKALAATKPPVEYDEIELIQDDVKYTNYWDNKAKQQDADLASLPSDWISIERDTLSILLSKLKPSRRGPIENLLRLNEAEAALESRNLEDFSTSNRRNWEMRLRSLILLKNKGQIVGAIERDDEDAATKAPEKGFRCDGNKISAAWFENDGFVPVNGDRPRCQELGLSLPNQACLFRYNFEFNGLVIPNPDTSNVYGHSQPAVNSPGATGR